MYAMRCSCVLLLCSSICLSGCAALIANSGTDVSALGNREAVHAKFGAPKAVGTSQEGPYEEYQTRRKLSDPLLAVTYGMAFALTLGLSEPLCLIIELNRQAKNTVAGQSIRFNYDENGELTSAKYGAFDATVLAD